MDTFDDKKYQALQAEKQEAWENICQRCGACCGSLDGDPCEHLFLGPQQKYQCQIYSNRSGEHKTKSGSIIKCMQIRDILFRSWPGSDRCAYKRDKGPQP